MPTDRSVSLFSIRSENKEETWDNPLHPYFHRFDMKWWDWVQGVVMTPIVLVRLLGFVLSLFFGWLLAQAVTLGLTFEETTASPLSPWRRRVKWVVTTCCVRAVFFFLGFQWVSTKGKQARRDEAPILVVAPHCSYIDAFPLAYVGAPSVVAKTATRNYPFFGKLIDITQPIYVDRDSTDSRYKTKSEINRRVMEPGWPQVFIFPEGTNTNRAALTTFRTGAFTPGVPVQPVIIRYPNKKDWITWTYDCMSVLFSVWVGLTQFHNYMHLEFLPVYTPSEEEKADPVLFMTNVRDVMAAASGLDIVEFSAWDGLELTALRESGMPNQLAKIYRLRTALKVLPYAEREFMNFMQRKDNPDWMLTINQLGQGVLLLSPPISLETSDRLTELFVMFGTPGEITMDVRPYMFKVFCVNPNIDVQKLCLLLFVMYSFKTKEMTRENFILMMQDNFLVKNSERSVKIFEATTSQHLIHREKKEIPPMTRKNFIIKMTPRVMSVRMQGIAVRNRLQDPNDYPARSLRDRFPHDHND